MATIRAACNEHGDLEMTPEELVVRVCVDNGEGAYVFTCPREGGHPVTRPIEPRICEMLIAAGCRLERWSLPKELDERKTGPVINHDDLLDAHRLMHDEAQLELALKGLIQENQIRSEIEGIEDHEWRLRGGEF